MSKFLTLTAQCLLVAFFLQVMNSHAEDFTSVQSVSNELFSSAVSSGAENNVPNYTPNHPTFNTTNLEDQARAKAAQDPNAIAAMDSYRTQNFTISQDSAYFNQTKSIINSLSAQYPDCRIPNTPKICSIYKQDTTEICNATLVSGTVLYQYLCSKEKSTSARNCTKSTNLTCEGYSYDQPQVVSNNFPGYSYSFPNLYLSLGGRGHNCHGYHNSFSFKIAEVNSIESFVLRNVVFDDRVYIWVNGTLVYGAPGGSSCEYSTVFNQSPNIDLKRYLVPGVNTIRTRLVVGGWGTLSTAFELKYKKCTNIKSSLNSNCEPLETNKRCELKNSICTNEASKSFGEVTLPSQCLSRDYTYSCVSEEFDIDGCKKFTEDTECIQVATSCDNYLKNECYKFQNKFECSTERDISNTSGVTALTRNENQLVYKDDCATLDASCKFKASACVQDSSSGICKKYEKSYNCKADTNNCSALNHSCTFLNEKCAKQDKGQCLITDRYYNCPNPSSSQTMVCGSQDYCSGVDCNKKLNDKSSDLASAATALALLSEVAKDFDKDNLKLFTGGDNSCDKSKFNYNNCCTDSGIGNDAGLASCSASEKNLIDKKKAKLCVYVGSYCSEKEKLTNTCLKTRYSYCCYNSKLARIAHEQGGPQLGRGFGSPESPNCQGFTIEQFQSLDFSRIDFSEAFADAVAKIKAPDSQQDLVKIQQKLNDFFSNLRSGGGGND